LQINGAPSWHGLPGIHQDVQEDLLNLPLVRIDLPKGLV
jgi:hypothetical protein